MNINSLIQKFDTIISSKYFRMILMFLFLITIGLLFTKSCNTPKPTLQFSSTTKDYILHKEKLYNDSLKIKDRQIKQLSEIKQNVKTEYIVKKETIVKYKEKIITEHADTQGLIILYDSTLAVCDSLNRVNDTLISNHIDKERYLDSLLSSSSYKNYLKDKDIATLQSTLRKQKVKSTGKSIGLSLSGLALGFLGGFLAGHLK